MKAIAPSSVVLFVLTALLFSPSIIAQAQPPRERQIIISKNGMTVAAGAIDAEPQDARGWLSEPAASNPALARQLDQQLNQPVNQWRQFAQFDEGDVRALFVDGERVYAGTANRGVFVSGDNGQTWSEAGAGLGNRGVLSFVRFGDAVLAGAAGGVFRSTNGGQSWAATGLSEQTINDFAVVGSRLYAATSSGNVFRSGDALNWTAMSNGLPAGRAVTAVEAVGNTLFAGIGPFAVAAAGIYRSTDGGQNWTAVNTAQAGFSAVNGLAVVGDRLFAAANFISTTASTVYVSADSGQTWATYGQAISSNLGDGTIVYGFVNSLFGDGLALYVASASVSVNQGQNWSEVAGARGLPLRLNVYAIARAGGMLLAGTNCGVFALSADGASWTRSSAGLKASAPTVSVSGETVIASTRSGAIFYSTDNGQSWTPANQFAFSGNGRPRNVTAFAVFNAAWYVAGYFGAVYRSTDNGRNWTAISAGLMPSGFSAASGLAVVNGRLHTVYGGVVHVLGDGGGSWTPLGDLPGSQGTSVRFALSGSQLAGSGNSLYAVSSGALFRSTDGGVTFARVPMIPSSLAVTNITIAGANVLAGTSVGVFISSDNGQNWNPSLLNFFSAGEFARIGNTLFSVSPEGSGVSFSNDDGQSWRPVNVGLMFRVLNSLAAKGETLLVGTEGGGLFAAVNPNTQMASLASVSAASFAPDKELAPESIVAGFGAYLATETRTAGTVPLPTELARVSVIVRDSLGAERFAPLFFISPGQVNYQIPPGTAEGRATITVTYAGIGVGLAGGEATIAKVAPSLFAANANGQGVAAAVLLRIRADGSQRYEPVAQFDAAQNRVVAVPIDLGAETDQVFLIPYGTGLRFRGALSTVTATIGGANAEVLFAGAAPGFIGLDQINLRLPRSLAGRGNVNILLTADDKATNIVTVAVK